MLPVANTALSDRVHVRASYFVLSMKTFDADVLLLHFTTAQIPVLYMSYMLHVLCPVCTISCVLRSQRHLFEISVLQWGIC